MLYIALSVDEMVFSFFFPRSDILVDGCNSLGSNSIRHYLLFRARDNSYHFSCFNLGMFNLFHASEMLV